MAFRHVDIGNKIKLREIIKKENPIGILYIPYYEFDFLNDDKLNSILYSLGFVLLNIIIISTLFAYFYLDI